MNVFAEVNVFEWTKDLKICIGQNLFACCGYGDI